MKKIYLVICLMAFSALIKAQVYEGKVEYNKEKQACLMIDYTFSQEAVENAFISKLNEMGYRGKEEKGLFNRDKGFRVYKNAQIGEISETRYDYVFFVSEKSRREDDKSVLQFLILKDDANVLNKLSSAELSQARSFLTGLVPNIEAADLELKIAAQDETIGKAEKKLRSLQDDKEDMEKKIKKLQDDIEKNLKDQDDQEKEIEGLKKVLDDLKAKRKKNA